MGFLKKYLFVFILITKGFTLLSQEKADITKSDIVINEPLAVKELMQKQREINSTILLKGYRIKIHFGTDKTKAKDVKSKFVVLFPKTNAYEKYDQPNFNIRVGDFKTKLEAYKFLKDVLIEFPGAFIVQDEIEVLKLE